MEAEKCCGSCDNFVRYKKRIYSGISPSEYFSYECAKWYCIKNFNDYCENFYKPRNPVKSKHEKILDEICKWMHNSEDEIHTGKEILQMMSHIEGKHNADTN